jgi:hypothetical protein
VEMVAGWEGRLPSLGMEVKIALVPERLLVSCLGKITWDQLTDVHLPQYIVDAFREESCSSAYQIQIDYHSCLQNHGLSKELTLCYSFFCYPLG